MIIMFLRLLSELDSVMEERKEVTGDDINKFDYINQVRSLQTFCFLFDL